MIVGAAIVPCDAKSYRVAKIHVDAAVSSDGSMRVTENITYIFDGSFKFAYRDIPTKPGERLSGFVMSDDEKSYTRSDGEQPGTYGVAENGGVTRITWYYRAKNQNKTFSLAYTIHGLVQRHNDIAELYYQFVGGDWDRPIGDVFVRVRMPEGVRASDLRAWAHGPLHGVVEIADPSAEVTLAVAPLPARTFWEARILCPPELFSDVASSPGGDRMAAILAEEAAWAAEANKRREARRERAEVNALRARERSALAKKLLPICVFLALAGLAIWFVLFRRHGWPHPTRTHVAPGEIPSKHPPAVLSYLLHRTVSGPSIVATLVDLANRGYLEIHESEKSSRSWFGKEKVEPDYRFELTAKPKNGIEGFERELLEFMMTEAGDSNAFTMSGLKKTASKNRSKFQKWFRKWVKSVSEYGKTLGFYEPYPVGAMVFNALCGVAIAVVGVIVCVQTDSPGGIPAIVGGSIQAILTVSLTRRTAEGRRLHQEWTGFKKHLKKISKALGPTTLDSSSWAAYVAGAIVFGMHKKLIPKIQMMDDSGRTVFPVWYYGMHGATFDQSFSGLSTGFSTMIESVSTTVSSASGVGGGASAGGGGGSGGGGGGAG
jgi:uncharacterized membrane protein